jgi:hypothetical protein
MKNKYISPILKLVRLVRKTVTMLFWKAKEHIVLCTAGEEVALSPHMWYDA